MAKRFIDTFMFRKNWFFKLSTDAKLLWIYLITNCDCAGILEINFDLAEFETGISNIEGKLNQLSKQVVKLNNKYLFIPSFIDFQYTSLSEECRAHTPIIKRLKELNLVDDKLRVCKGYAKGINTPIEKEKEKEKEIKGGYGGEKLKKPTLEEIKKYCKERNNSVDAEKWLSHYESNGWKVGKNSMKDWRAAVRTWERNSFEKTEGVKAPAGKYANVEVIRAKNE